jgi:hypothetical protein
MDSLSKLLVGGVTVSLGLGLIVYYLSDDGTGPSQSSQSLRKDQVIEILKDLKKELSNVYMTISTFANSMKEQSGGRLPESALKEILITQTPIQSFIARAETKIYDQHGITEAELKLAVEQYKNSEIEVEKLILEMKNNLELAYKGILPADDAPIPDFITSELTLKILFEMYDSGKYITYKQLAQIKARGIVPNPNNEEFIKAIQEMEVEADIEKNKLFERHGLAGLEDSPAAILRRAQQKFASTEPGFKQKLTMLEEEYSYTMGLIMEDKLPQQEVQRLTKKYAQVEI